MVQTSINGYEVEKPFGRKVKEVDIAFIVSVASRDVIEDIESLSSAFGTMHDSFLTSQNRPVQQVAYYIENSGSTTKG